jgi:putative ABC transport system permease protein
MPAWNEEIRKHLSPLKLTPTRENEIVEELSQDLEDRYFKLQLDGLSETEASAVVLKELAESDLWTRELQRVEHSPKSVPTPPGAQNSTNIFSDLRQDFRYAVRMLLKNPAFTAVAITALALGIGANSAIFSVVNSVLLEPLPYKNPDELVMVWEDATKQGYPRDTPAAANYVDWRDQNQTFVGMAVVDDDSFNLTGVGDPEKIEGRRVSANLFSLLGVEPQLGRAFTPDEDQPGANGVVLISHLLWQRRFNGDPNIIGKSLKLNDASRTVVGVMPASFQFPTREDELWVPIAFSSEEAANRNRHYLEVLGRLKPGISVQQAQADMTAVATRLQQQYPDSNTDLGAEVTPLREQLVGDIKPALMILLGAVGLVLLIACANVANLLLARAAVRQKEIAVRVALGASRMRLVRQFLTESVLLSVLAGILGLLLSVAGLYLLKSFIPPDISQTSVVSIDVRVLGFTLLVSVLTGLIFGLAPALQAANFNLNETLKEGGRDPSAGGRTNHVRSLLVIAEVAISLVLLIGAGLLINSFLRLRNTDPGFSSDDLLTMKVVLPEPKYSERPQRNAFYTAVLNKIESIPGVKSAALTTNLPLYRQGNSISITFQDRPAPPPGQEVIITTRIVSPSYFETMGIQLLKGRQFTAQDNENSQRAVIVSEGMARRYWPDQDVLGKRISPGTPQRPEDWFQVVGVVNDVHQFQLDIQPKPQMYLTYRQAGFFDLRDLVVKTEVEPTSLAATVRRSVWEIDKEQPVSNISTMEGIIAESLARQRFSMLLLGIFAAVAMILAAVGIYGVMSYSVAQRRNEIGIRMALGAQKMDVLKLTVGSGLKLVVIGLVLGLIGAVLLTRLMSTLLFGISATDPLTFVLISAILVAVALLASYIPARRATKVDPLVALRYE